MGKPLSTDLRERIVADLNGGNTRRGAAARFEVAPSTVVRLKARYDETGTVAAARVGRPPGSGKPGDHRAFIISQVEERPDITMPALAALLAERGVAVDPSNLSKFLCKAGYSYKKTLLAAERERADVKAERDAWHEHRLPAIRPAPARLVFIDETSVKTNMTPVRGAAPKARGSLPMRRLANGIPRPSLPDYAATNWWRLG